MSVVKNSKLVNLVPDDDDSLNKHVDKLKWCVVKFVSPEDNIQKKQLFDLNRFLYHDVNQQLVDMSTNIVMNVNNEFDSSVEAKVKQLKSSKDPNDQRLAESLLEIKKELKIDEEYQSTKILRQYRIDQQEMIDRFETYKLENRQALEKDFAKEVTPQTCVRGFKVSGAYETLEEARSRAKHVNQDIEPHINAYAVPLRVWIPWDPNPDAAQDQEFMLDELNDLMGKYKEGVEAKNEIFEKRKRAMIDKAKEDNNALLKERLRQRAGGT
jgi:hypothetical protein